MPYLACCLRELGNFGPKKSSEESLIVHLLHPWSVQHIPTLSSHSETQSQRLLRESAGLLWDARETFNKKAIFGPPACLTMESEINGGCSRKGEKVRAEVKLEREKVQTLR